MRVDLRRSYRDVTDQAERLQISHQRFSSVTESARDGIVSTDERGAITFWNRSAGVIFGCCEGEAVGGPLTRFIAESDRRSYLDVVSTLGSGEEHQATGRTIEVIAVREDASTFPAEISLSTWQAGTATSVTAIVRDITERKQAEEQRRRHQDEIESQRLRVFRATMTTVHDIFNNFLMNMQLIRMEAEGHLPEETLLLFERLIQENAAELRVLSDLQTVREKEMAVGTGIEYPKHQDAPLP
jgi:PAS domain S-box-containing protein